MIILSVMMVTPSLAQALVGGTGGTDEDCMPGWGGTLDIDKNYMLGWDCILGNDDDRMLGYA